MNQEQPSYCLDIRVGHNEQERDILIEFLKHGGKFFEVGKAQRGMWQGAKILRVETPKATELAQHIMKSLRLGDDYDYEIHETFTDANRSDTWLPDFDTMHGHERFDLASLKSAANGQAQFDSNVGPEHLVNIDADRIAGLFFNKRSRVYTDAEGSIMRDEFGQPL